MAGRLARATWDSLVAGALAATLVVGSAFVWLGIPPLGLWAAGELSATPERFLLLALCGIPLAMVLFAFLLYRVSRVYERLHPTADPAHAVRSAWLRSSSEGRRRARRPRTLFEAAMVASAWIAVLVMAVWFFFFAELILVSP